MTNHPNDRKKRLLITHTSDGLQPTLETACAAAVLNSQVLAKMNFCPARPAKSTKPRGNKYALCRCGSRKFTRDCCGLQ